MGAPMKIADSVAHLDLAVVAKTLVKHGANVRNAAIELRVPVSDLRKLALANQELLDAAYEAEENRLDRAEAVVDEALQSDDSRRKDAAAFFVLRNMAKSKRRGWLPNSSASVDVNVQTSQNQELRLPKANRRGRQARRRGRRGRAAAR